MSNQNALAVYLGGMWNRMSWFSDFVALTNPLNQFSLTFAMLKLDFDQLKNKFQQDWFATVMSR